MNSSFNKFIYIGFILFGIYELAIKQSPSDAVTFLGIALAFDPFDQTQPWKQRPTWQKVVLIIHLAVVFGLFGYMVGNNNSDFRKGMKDGWEGK
jgi:H+/Cl- antiporter ClcA